jgi:hypothetical protein
MTLRERIAQLLPFFVHREFPERAASPEEAIAVPSAVQRVDSAYERFRNLLDPGDEDILRRKAIVRFLRRRWELAASPETLAQALLKDLAYGRYIPNDTHRRHAEAIALVVQKALTVWQQSGRVMHRWFLPFVAVEIDRVLYPREADDALVYTFFEDTRERIVWEDTSVDETDRDAQLFLACHRALAKTDDAELFWHLFRTAEPAWIRDASDPEIQEIAERFPGHQKEIERVLHHPTAFRLFRRLQPAAVPYRILRDALRREDAETVLADPEQRAEAVRAVLSDRIRKLERQMFRRVWHAAIFLFLSKGVLAFALEIPYELVLGNLRVVPLIINLLFPPTLLFLMTGSVPRPGRANTERLLRIIDTLVSGEGDAVPLLIIRVARGGAIRRGLFALLYGLITIALFAGIIWFLQLLQFSLVGGLFFIMFLAIVSFLGLRLRSLVRDIRVVAPRESLLGGVIDFLTLPIIDLGRQITLHASQINVFLFLLDAVIEAPFKVLLGLVEEWFAFLREKKEELV